MCVLSTASTDADGDTISYTFDWDVDGSAYSGTTYTTTLTDDTISNADTTIGEEWLCTAWPHDGDDWGSEGTDTVTIGYGDEWAFLDTSADDVAADALYDFFSSLSLSTSDYIFVEVDGGSLAYGALCSQRADWYASTYVSNAAGSGTTSSGSWTKYYKTTSSGSWSSGTTTSYTNYWGSSCDAFAYSWCAEWGIGGEHTAILPGNTSSGECYADGRFSAGSNWSVTVRVGTSRSAACGF